MSVFRARGPLPDGDGILGGDSSNANTSDSAPGALSDDPNSWWWSASAVSRLTLKTYTEISAVISRLAWIHSLFTCCRKETYKVHTGSRQVGSDRRHIHYILCGSHGSLSSCQTQNEQWPTTSTISQSKREAPYDKALDN